MNRIQRRFISHHNLVQLERLGRYDRIECQKSIHLLTNDITVGWDINQITTNEVSELFAAISKKMLKFNLAIPIQLIDSWIYVLHFPEEHKGIKTLKFIGRSLNLTKEQRINSIKKLLHNLDGMFDDVPVESQGFVQEFFTYLLESAYCKEDVLVIFDAFLDLNLDNSEFWSITMAKLLQLKDSPVELISSLFHRMAVIDKCEPRDFIKPLLQSHQIASQKNSHNHGSRFLENLDLDSTSIQDYLLRNVN